MAVEWTDLLVVHGERVRLGTLVRLGVALGWDVDDLAVKGNDSWVYLLRRKDGVADRPPVMVLAGQEALDEYASRPWEVFDRRTGQPTPGLLEPPPADGDAAPLDAPLAAFDEAMAAKAAQPTLPSGRDILAKSSSAEVTPAADAPPEGFEVFQRPRPGVRECPKCGRTMETSGAVEVHLKRDHGPKSVACPDCGYVYATEVGMQRHRRSRHPRGASDEPTRHCSVCQRELVSADDAREHEATLHADGAEAVACEDCGWVFADSSGLNHHITMKHGGAGTKATPHGSGAPAGPPRVRCTDCDYSSLFADDLNNHCLSEHRRRATPLERTPSQTGNV